MSDQNTTLQQIKEESHRFCETRNWQAYNTPKNLAMALGVESGELSQLFVLNDKTDQPDEIKDEISDVFFVLIELCYLLEIDLASVIQKRLLKLKPNEGDS